MTDGADLVAGPWTPLAGGRGSSLAVRGDVTAAAQLGRMTVWSGDRVVAQVEAVARNPGRPRVTERSVLWGDTVLDLASGDVRRLEGVHTALGFGTGASGRPSPGSGYLPAAYAWSEDGEALVASARWTGPPGPPPARVVLLDGTGAHVATLWEGTESAPRALWAGGRSIVVGTYEPRVYGRGDGALENLLPQRPPAARIDADTAERWLLITDHAGMTAWTPGGWEPAGAWEGSWLDGAIAPGRPVAVAVDMPGLLHTARVDDGSSPMTELTPPDPVQSVAIGEDRIVASFVRGEGIRWAPLG